MAESTATLTAWDLLERVARFSGWTTNPQGDEFVSAKRFVESGYRTFLLPPATGKYAPGHRWRFLSPSATLALVADDYDLDLPDDFGGFVEPLHYPAGTGFSALREVSPAEINELRAGSTSTGDPCVYAIRPKALTSSTGQRWEVLFYPTPSTVRTMVYRYASLPGALFTAKISGTVTISGASYTVGTVASGLTAAAVVAGDKVVLSGTGGPTEGIYVVSSKDSDVQFTLTSGAGTTGSMSCEIYPATRYPLGGMMHSQTLLEACLSEAELEGNDEVGIHNAKFLQRLESSIAYDLAQGPSNLGYNGDASDRQGRSGRSIGSVYYNGDLIGSA